LAPFISDYSVCSVKYFNFIICLSSSLKIATHVGAVYLKRSISDDVQKIDIGGQGEK
jgi:hypothetical protein